MEVTSAGLLLLLLFFCAGCVIGQRTRVVFRKTWREQRIRLRNQKRNVYIAHVDGKWSTAVISVSLVTDLKLSVMFSSRSAQNQYSLFSL